MEIFAHRGASGDHPENTLIAVERALDLGADGIEIDLQLADNQVMVFHDRWLNPITNGQGRLRDLTFEQLRAVEVAGSQQIPTFMEVLDCMQGRGLLNAELKHKEVVEPALKVLESACREFGFAPEQIIISSFHHRSIMQLKERWPQYQYAGLTASVPLDLSAFAQRIGCNAVHMDINNLDEDLIQDAHQRGLKVRVYTVDEPDDLKLLKTLGVDGIFTNFPARAIRQLRP